MPRGRDGPGCRRRAAAAQRPAGVAAHPAQRGGPAGACRRRARPRRVRGCRRGRWRAGPAGGARPRARRPPHHLNGAASSVAGADGRGGLAGSAPCSIGGRPERQLTRGTRWSIACPSSTRTTTTTSRDDAWTRHLDPTFADRAFHVRRGEDGVGRAFFGDNPRYYLASTPVDRMGRPGARVHERKPLPTCCPRTTCWRRARSDGLRPARAPPAVDGRAVDPARLAVADLGLTVEHLMRDDPEASVANLVSFNRWLDEDWGFDHQRRISPCR